MIIEIRAKNCFSFKDQIRFSMKADILSQEKITHQSAIKIKISVSFSMNMKQNILKTRIVSLFC